MIPVAEALARILQKARPLAVEEVPLDDTLGRALAEPLIAPRALPPWDNSSMDGYAVRAADLTGASDGAPRSLRVTFAIPAGGAADRRVESGTCARILTGAPIPDGADAVVMQEHTRQALADELLVLRPVEPGANIRRRASDVAQGAEVLPAGTHIGAGEIAMLASQGFARVEVHRQPRVAVLATGDELCLVEEDPGPGRIVASSSHALVAAVGSAGGTPIGLGIAHDELEETTARVQAGLSGADVLITTGGVSVGDHDLVREVFARAGCEERFWRVAIKPGKPIYFGVGPEGTLVFGLPGNPVSTLVTFEVFVRPALRAMAGHRVVRAPELKARLDRDLRKRAGRIEYVRAHVRATDSGLVATPLSQQSSGALASFVGVNALVVFARDETACAAGDRVDVMLLELPEPVRP